MVSWNTYQKCADDVNRQQFKSESKSESKSDSKSDSKFVSKSKSKSKFMNLFDEVKAMNKKPVGPTKGEWWFLAWGLVIGATLMGSMLTLMQVIGG